MSKNFTYSILQYRHSIPLREILNVGILFYFPDERKFEFVSGDGSRAKSIYPDFDNSLFNSYLKVILQRVKNHVDLFTGNPAESDFSKYIHSNILAEDAAGLIFSNSSTVENVFGSNEKAIAEFTKLLLPGISFEKQTIIRHNEQYIIRRFHNYVFQGNNSLEEKFLKNQIIKTKHSTIKFDLCYKTKTGSSFIKPVNLDFNEESAFQNKAATFYGYISELANLGSSQKNRYDFLLSKPQDSRFQRAYENALDFLDSAKAPKQLITEEKLEDYSQWVVSELLIA